MVSLGKWILNHFTGHMRSESGLGATMAALLGGLAAGGASGGMSLLGNMFGGSGQKMEQGWDVYKPEPFDWTVPSLRDLNSYYTGGLSNLKAGNAPQWWQNAQPKLQEGMSRVNNQTFFGVPGLRSGTVNNAMSIGAMAGLRGKAAAAPGRQALLQYQDREAAINDYLTQLGVGVMQQSEQLYTQGIQNQKWGPEYQVINRMGGVSGGNQTGQQLAQLGGTILGNYPWENMFSNMGQNYGGSGQSYNNLMSSNTTSNTSPISYSNYASQYR